jgi:hypothetical protein
MLLRASGVLFATARAIVVVTAGVARAEIPFSAQVIDAANSGDCKAVADIDLDGIGDPIIGGGSLVWYDGGAGFAKRVVRATPVYGQFTTGMQAADVDDDGDADMVVGDDNGPDNVLWF